MRWNGQRVGAEAQSALPGADGDVVVRRFDAPEALETRFYEVRAKSALNRVTGGARVPFEWTINPYRGCSHACSYCIEGSTPVLLADGRLREMSALAVGDAIIGTERRGSDRRCVETQVLAHWSTVKPAHRVTLEDSRTLVTSADHRFLTSRGWRYVTGADRGAARRPHLAIGAELVGTGAFAAPPEPDEDYRRGYVCGLFRGDGQVGHDEDRRPGRVREAHHRFRLASAGDEALDRAAGYLRSFGVPTVASPLPPAHRGRPRRALGTSERPHVERVGELIRWPRSASETWRKGFLAGVLDAEGTRAHGASRTPDSDSTLVGWAGDCLRHFSFDAAFEPGNRADASVGVQRIRGGLAEQRRLLHLTDPAIRPESWLSGRALESSVSARVSLVEPLGEARLLYDMTTGTGDFVSDGVVSHNCFARPTHEYLGLGAGRDFEREIVVKVNVPEVLRAELARPSWKRAHVALGTNTDPYQWVEGRYRLMRGIWEAMRDFANPCSVLTKSPLVLRDADLLLEVAKRTTVSACLSVPTLEEKAWRATEPHTPHPRARLEAVAELNRRGIPTGILIAPLMPGINDDPAQVERILALAADAGATTVGGQTLFLRGATRDVFMDWLRSQRPDLVPRYEALYARGSYAPREERARIEAPLRRATSTTAMTEERFFRRGGRRVGAPPPAPSPPPGGGQEALF